MQCTKPKYLHKQSLFVPCGKCTSCRIARGREWAVRIIHEMKYTNHVGSFVTLTYSNEHLPGNFSLSKNELQRFMKRLRKQLDGSAEIKYIACGEYGENKGRPHYHAIILGIPPDKDTERLIKSVWKYGRIDVGNVTYQSARYVADYIGKSHIGKDAWAWYGLRQPPFQLQSKGLGLRFVEEFGEHVKDALGITLYGQNVGIPRYYKKKLGIDGDDLGIQIEESRMELREYIDREFGGYSDDDALEEHVEFWKIKQQKGRNADARIKLKKKGNL